MSGLLGGGGGEGVGWNKIDKAVVSCGWEEENCAERNAI